jgi:hypothetical protein
MEDASLEEETTELGTVGTRIEIVSNKESGPES